MNLSQDADKWICISQNFKDRREVAPPVLRGLRVLVVSLEQEREIEHRIGVGRRGAGIRSRPLAGPARRAGQKDCTRCRFRKLDSRVSMM